MEKVFKEFGIVAASKNGRQQDNPAKIRRCLFGYRPEPRGIFFMEAVEPFKNGRKERFFRQRNPNSSVIEASVSNLIG